MFFVFWFREGIRGVFWGVFWGSEGICILYRRSQVGMLCDNLLHDDGLHAHGCHNQHKRVHNKMVSQPLAGWLV